MEILTKNAEGYHDPVPYGAIKTIESRKYMEVKRGEIYEIRMQNGEYRPAIIISSEERSTAAMQSVIILSDEAKGMINVPVICGVKQWVDCGMVSFVFRERISNYIRTATKEEIAEIDAGIMRSLGLDLDDNSEELRKQLECKRMENEDLRKMVEDLKVKEVSVPDNAEVIKMQTERDLYKSLYENMFARLLERLTMCAVSEPLTENGVKVGTVKVLPLSVAVQIVKEEME